MPRSVQQSIPIDRIYADGVWQSENVFSLMWQISDINYAMQSDAAKQNILEFCGFRPFRQHGGGFHPGRFS